MSDPGGFDPGALQTRVVDAGLALAAAGQEDMIWGHVAIRDPLGRGVWMKAAGWSFGEGAPERVLLVDWNGRRLHGEGTPHIESHIHLGILRARPDVGASVHTHPESVNAFTALNVPLRAISHDGVLFADPPVPRFDVTGDLIMDAKRGRLLAAFLGRARACLMPRHGLVAVGGDEAVAVMHAVLLTSACAAMLRSLSAGTIRSWSDHDEIVQKSAHAWPDSQLRAGYAHLVRTGRSAFAPPR